VRSDECANFTPHRRTRRDGPISRLQAAAEDGSGVIAIDLRAGRPTGSGDGQSAQPAPRCSQAAGRGARSRNGLSGTDHCRRRPNRRVSPRGLRASPVDDEIAGVNYSPRSPKGTRHMRRLLNQVANAVAGTKGSICEIVYRRSLPRRGHNQAIGAIARRQCPLIWLILGCLQKSED
jgi:hypothetical protein